MHVTFVGCGGHDCPSMLSWTSQVPVDGRLAEPREPPDCGTSGTATAPFCGTAERLTLASVGTADSCACKVEFAPVAAFAAMENCTLTWPHRHSARQVG